MPARHHAGPGTSRKCIKCNLHDILSIQAIFVSLFHANHSTWSCFSHSSRPLVFSSMMTQPALDTVQPIQPVPIRGLMMSSVVADKTLSMKKKLPEGPGFSSIAPIRSEPHQFSPSSSSCSVGPVAVISHSTIVAGRDRHGYGWVRLCLGLATRVSRSYNSGPPRAWFTRESVPVPAIAVPLFFSYRNPGVSCGCRDLTCLVTAQWTRRMLPSSYRPLVTVVTSLYGSPASDQSISYQSQQNQETIKFGDATSPGSPGLLFSRLLVCLPLARQDKPTQGQPATNDTRCPRRH